VREAVEAAGCRAIVAGEEGGARILRIGDAPHSRLFPRVAAVVHHGGAGTIAAAARAGVPQVILPHAFDQPLWAAQAHRLGIAPPPIPARAAGAAALAEALRAALHDPRLRERARALGAALAARRPVDAAVAHVTGELP
jgi:vancomycin aglycone glucosyltransferase